MGKGKDTNNLNAIDDLKFLPQTVKVVISGRLD